MASKLDKVYAIMPVGVQNLMVSIKGLTLTRKRYGGKYSKYVSNLMKSQWYTREMFREIQTAELRKLLKEVCQNTTYYREALKRYSGKVESITLENMNELPLLEKSLLRSNVADFINGERMRRGYEEGHTSGTSGIPLVWPYDYDSLQLDLAFRERQYRWAGITGREKSARFSGRIILGKHNNVPYWRHNGPENQWLFSTYHITDKTLPVYYRALTEIDFAYLDGYPSALYAIAKWINAQGKNAQWRPWVIITTAETLMEFQREEIEKAFGCRVFNFYSSSEGSPFITQCQAGKMHLNPESGIIEFLLPDGTEAKPGEEAEMVVTSFFQRTMPIIRYSIGDRGALAEEQVCSCGRQMPIVKYIAGRESDVLYSTERGRIGSAGLSTVFYKIPSRIRESQIEQVGTDSFVYRYVPLNGPLNEKEIAIVFEQLMNRLGSSVKIDIQMVERLAHAETGKSQLVIGLEKNKEQKR